MERKPTYSVDGWNNFCRVFELPENYPSDYCFGGGIPVTFKMVDWFNPVAMPVAAITKEAWLKKVGEIETMDVSYQELYDTLAPFIKDRPYTKAGRSYLVLCDFGAVLLIEGVQ